MTFKVKKVIQDIDEPGARQSLTLVKLSNTHIARKVGSTSYVEAHYALVGIASLDKEDETGKFHYEETCVTVSDKKGTSYQAFLYLSTKALTLEEAMFSIGELELKEEPPTEPPTLVRDEEPVV